MDNTKKKIFKLSNGIKVLIIPLETKLTNVSVSILLGSTHEKKGEADLTHYMEHLMGRFTSKKYKNYDFISKELSKRGADINAYVSEYETKFYISGFYKDLPFFLDLLSNTINSFHLISSIAENEKNAVIEELEKYKSHHEYPFDFKVFSFLYPKYSYHYDYEYQIKVIKKYDIKNIYEYIRTHVLLQNITISVSCPLDAIQKTKTLITKTFNFQNNQKKRVIRYPTFNNNNKIFKIIQVKNKNKDIQSILKLHVDRKIDYLSKEHICLIFLNNIFFDFNTGVFYNILRKDLGLIYYIRMNINADIANSKSSSYEIETSTNNKNIPITIKHIIDIINKITITKEEFHNGKIMLLHKTELHKFFDLTSYNEYYEKYLLHNTPIIERSEIQKRITAITYDDLTNYLKKFKNNILKTGILFYYSHLNMNLDIKKIIQHRAKYLQI